MPPYCAVSPPGSCLLGRVLDPEDGRRTAPRASARRRRSPGRGHKAGRANATSNACGAELVDETHRVGTVHARVASPAPSISMFSRDRARTLGALPPRSPRLRRRGTAPRGRARPSRRTGRAPSRRDVGLDDAHPRFANAVGGRADAVIVRRRDPAAAPPPGDDRMPTTSAPTADVGEARLQRGSRPDSRRARGGRRRRPQHRPASSGARSPIPTPIASMLASLRRRAELESVACRRRAAAPPTRTPRETSTGDGLPMPNGSKWRSNAFELVVDLIDRDLEVDRAPRASDLPA